MKFALSSVLSFAEICSIYVCYIYYMMDINFVYINDFFKINKYNI